MSSQLSTKFRHQITWNGYPLDLVKSGLQKYIRRGETLKALYCAGEVDLFKTAGKEGEGVRTNFLNRFLVMYMEDVENLSILEKVNTIITALFKEREKTGSDRSIEKEEEWISELVIILCHSTKTRMCSHVRAIFNKTYHTPELMKAYPSIAPIWQEIETNTKEMLSKKRNKLLFDCERFVYYFKNRNILSVYYAFQITSSEDNLDTRLLGSKKPVWFVFNQLLQVSSSLTTIMITWFKNYIGGMKEDFMCWLIPLLSVLGHLPKGNLPAYRLEDFPHTWDRNRSGETLVMNDYTVDRHTKMGRSKSLVEFALVGAHVENEASYVNPLWKSFYNDGKRWEDGQSIQGEIQSMEEHYEKEETDEKDVLVNHSDVLVNHSEQERNNPPKETDEYDIVVRTQITTSSFKMDVYLARDTHTQKFVVVKGPYKNREEMDILKRNTEWKIKHHLPYIPFVIRSLIPDRWPEGVPLGARNKINRSQPAYFLVFDSVIDPSELQIKYHSSKVWPVTEVVDWDKLPLHFDYQSRTLTEQEWKDYVHALLFRYVLGVSDLADRNFLMRKGRVISIDEDVENHEVDLYANLKKKKADAVYQWLKGNYRKLNVTMWSLIQEDEKKEDRLKVVKNYNTCLRLFRPSHEDIEEPVISNIILPKKIPRPQVRRSDGSDEKKPEESNPKPEESKPKPEEDVKNPDNIKSSVSTVAFVASIRYPAMNDNFVFIDNVYRSRLTLLDILKERGYDVSKYEKFSPAEATAAASAFTGLSFHVSKKDDEKKECHIRYENISQQKLKGHYFTDLVSDDDCENVEIIMMMSTHVTDTHHGITLKEYMRLKEEPNEKGVKERRKLRVAFFSIDMLVINPLRHVLVPKHELVPEAEHKELMERLYVTAKSKFPEIKFHIDMIARCIGAVPGDIVKITRPSASAGNAIIYRVCAP